jgi:mannan endo-1,4-beta-mannosidase
MKNRSFSAGLLTAILVISSFSTLLAQSTVNPNATPEARALLDLYYRISGKYTLTGQHNYPSTRDLNSRFAFDYIGQTPVIWSSDMGFAKDGDKDSYLARPEIVKEAIRQHNKGSIITLCWHAVPPTATEPVTFQPRRKMAPDSLNSVQGQLTDPQFIDVLTPGTKLYNSWAAQVDTIAVYLKKLQDAHVPVLWRPYHEMNGDWFWWGGRTGAQGTAALYRQLYDRMVNYHKLNNLVWVWNVDRPSTPVRKFSNFYPGNQYLDILSLDVYGSDFNQAYYDSLISLSKGKPVLFGEVGNPPVISVFEHQPKWASWVIWAGMVRNLTKTQYQEIYNDPRMLSREDPAYWEVIAPLRKACGLSPLPLKDKYPVNFSGHWVFNEDRSELGNGGAGNVPGVIDIDQDDELLHVKKLMVSEWNEDEIRNEEVNLDGTEIRSEVFNSPRVSKAGWDEESKSIQINSLVKFSRGGQDREMKSKEAWSLEDGGKILKMKQTSSNFNGGENTVVLVFEKQ